MPQLTQEASGGEGTRKKSTVAWGLSAGVAVLMLLQSLAGVVFPGLYRDVGWVTAAWYGNDLVTALRCGAADGLVPHSSAAGFPAG